MGKAKKKMSASLNSMQNCMSSQSLHSYLGISQQKVLELIRYDRFPCNTHMNTICRLFLKHQKALGLFCLVLEKILVQLLVLLEGKLTATNHSKARQMFICFRVDLSIGHIYG